MTAGVAERRWDGHAARCVGLAVAFGLAGCSSTSHAGDREIPSTRATTEAHAAPTASTAASGSAGNTPSARRAARVLAVTTGNRFLRAALLDDAFEVVTVAPDAYATASGPFDVTVFEGVAPAATSGSGPAFYIHPSGPGAPLEVSAKALQPDDGEVLGFDTIVSTSPLVRGIAHLDQANVAEAFLAVPRPEDHVVGASRQGPLLVEGVRDGRRFVALLLDLSETDLPLRTAWPMLVANTIGELVGKDVYAFQGSAAAPPRASSPAAPAASTGAGTRTHKSVLAGAQTQGFGGADYRRVYGEYRTVADEELRGLASPVRQYVERYFDAIRPTDAPER